MTTLNSIPFHNDHKVYHVPIEDIIDKLVDQSDDINCAEKNHSDLIAGVYEGQYSAKIINAINILVIEFDGYFSFRRKYFMFLFNVL